MEKISQDVSLIDTFTTSLQRETEDECKPYFIDDKKLTKNQMDHLRELGMVSKEYDKSSPLSEHICLLRSKHLEYLQRPLLPKASYCLSKSFISLDASKPWIIYWCLQPLDLLGALDGDGLSMTPNTTIPFLKEESLIGIIHTLESCWMDTPLHFNDFNSSCYACLFGTDNRPENEGSCMGGGYGGGPGQIPHCAPSYAAILSLCIIAGSNPNHYPVATNLAQDVLNRKRQPMYLWFLSLRFHYHNKSSISKGQETSDATAYCMHHDGEIDVRATYTVLCMASLMNILTPELTHGVMRFIASCQTYEGGFAGEPNAEAHGGYTYCAIATLRLLTASTIPCCSSYCIRYQQSFHSQTMLQQIQQSGIDFHSLKTWLVYKQKSFEGGFAGRTNKLVDGCYSFWLGAAIALVNIIEKCYESSDGKDNGVIYESGIREESEFWVSHFISEDEQSNPFCDKESSTSNGYDKDNLLIDRTMLQRYILLCCQDLYGGLRDKPSKPRDFYHSCYVLSGLSISEHVLIGKDDDLSSIYGDCRQNQIFPTHPVYNIRLKHVQQAFERFHKPKN